MILLYILLATYILSVNFFAFRLIKSQRDAAAAEEDHAGDGKLLLAAALGGALTMYAAMFAYRYRRIYIAYGAHVGIYIACTAQNGRKPFLFVETP